LKAGQRTIGVLYVQCGETDRLNPQIVDLLHTLGDQMAVGLRNAQLYEELQGYAEELEARVEERAAVIQAQYAQLQAVLNSTTDGIVVIGDDGQIVLANSVAEEWLAQSLSPEEADAIRNAVRELAASSDEREERILELTGLDLQLRAAPVLGTEGEASNAVVAIHDVTHLKALDRMKSRFVSNVSHELRTPIATIKLLVHLMQKQPENWEDYIQSLAEEAEYQAQLVEDILEISRVDAGRIELEPEITDLGRLVEATVERHTTEADRRGLDLACEVDGVAVAWVDRHRLMQVLNNLISNALRYTPTGGDVTVSTGRARYAGRRWATLTVSDSGMGIPDDELPHIFERFFRGERPRAMQISGTGLGLAIVQEIVELHGGQISVQSAAGEGSTFTVMIPAVVSEDICSSGLDGVRTGRERTQTLV
jgi:signal transduction histidine kinase